MTPDLSRRRPLTVRMAGWSARHAYRAIGLWLAFVAAAVALAVLVPTQEASEADLRVGQSGRAEAIAAEAGLTAPPSENVLIRGLSGELGPHADEAVADLTQRMRSLPAVAEVGEPVRSADGSAVLVSVAMRADEDGAADDLPDVQAVTAAVAADHPELRVEQAGGVSLDEAVGQQVSDDLLAAEKLSLPVTFGILLLAFGALVAAGLPVLLALSGVVATLGIYAPISALVPDGGTVANVVLLIGLAVGVDYCLFFLRREREERAKGHGTVDAIEIAAATAGHSVLVSGAAVIVSLAGLFVVQDATFTSLATGAIIVVAVSVIGALTVLPAALSKLGRLVDRPRVPLIWRFGRRVGPGGISGRLLAPVLRRPVAALVAATAVAGAFAVPALGMDLRQSGLSSLPRSLPEVRTLTDIENAFPTEGSSYDIAVRTSPEELDAAVTALGGLADTAAASIGLEAGADAVRTAPGAGVAVLTLESAVPASADGADRIVADLRTHLVPAALGDIDGDWAVGGSVAENVDYAANQSSALPWVVGLVLGLTMTMMVVTFRSIVLALLTSILNLASVAIAFGVLVLVFQNTWAEGLLDFTSSGHVVSWIPLFLFVVLVGLSMDYHVFVLGRIREGMQSGLSPRAAVESGIRSTAGVVTSAAAVMVSVFAVFATLSLLEIKQMGVGLAVAVLVDATLIRLVMLPAAMLVLGRAAWWPGRDRRPHGVALTDPGAVATAHEGAVPMPRQPHSARR